MSQIIFEYTLDVVERQSIKTHTGAEALSLQLQHGKPTLWCMVDTRCVKCDRLIKMCVTGHEDPFPIRDLHKEYIGTIQLNGFVWHYFWGNIMDHGAVSHD